MTNTLAYYVTVVKRFDGRSDQLSERKTIKENEKFRSKEIKIYRYNKDIFSSNFCKLDRFKVM
jgi:hypothetical protein